MTVESATYISDLNTSNPAAGDAKSEGDDHLRLLKSTIKTTFPNVSGAVTPTHTELNYVDGVTSAIQTQIDAKAPKAAPTFTGNATFDTDTLFVDAANNRVGVGTTSPGVTLDVDGTVRSIGMDGGYAFRVLNTAQDGGGYFSPAAGTNGGVILAGDAGPVVLGSRFTFAEDGRIYGSALHNNAGAVTGTTNQYVGSGTYTPTGAAGTNVSAVTPRACQWMRVGNVVTVSGACSVDANTAGSGATFTLTLPIAADFTTAYQLGGTAVDPAGTRFAVYSDATNNVANFETNAAGSASAQDTWFSFTYVVV